MQKDHHYFPKNDDAILVCSEGKEIMIITHKKRIAISQARTAESSVGRLTCSQIGSNILITIVQRNPSGPIESRYTVSLTDQQHPYIKPLLDDIHGFIDTARSKSKIQFTQSINSFKAQFNHFFASPEVLSKMVEIDFNKIIFPVLYQPIAYSDPENKDSIGTIYNCGRPSKRQLSEFEQSHISIIATELRSFLNNTLKQESTHERPLPQNQGPICNSSIHIPTPFRSWLDHISPLLEAEKMTDTYHMEQSIRFLMARNRINPGSNHSASYCLNEHFATVNISLDQWTRTLAQALYLVQTSLSHEFNTLTTKEWEPKLECFLSHTLGFSGRSFNQHLASLEALPEHSLGKCPGINDDPTPFLTQFVSSELANHYSTNMTTEQQNLVKGLVYCQKVKLKEFIVAFTAGAKGRWKSNRHGGQCGAEYVRRARQAIHTHAQNTSAPTSFPDWVTTQIRAIRINVIREFLINTRTSETSTLEITVRHIEATPNPNLSLENKIKIPLIANLTINRCVDELHKTVKGASEAEKQHWIGLLEKEGHTTVCLESWENSDVPIYDYLEQLGLCKKTALCLPSDTDTQTPTVVRLIVDILCLSPNQYEPSRALDLSLSNHIAAFDNVKQKLLETCLTLPNLTENNRTLITQNLGTENYSLPSAIFLSTYKTLQERLTILEQAPPALSRVLLPYCRSDSFINDFSSFQTVAPRLYHSMKNKFSIPAVQTEREALMNSRLSDDFKIKCISTLYTAAKNIVTAAFVQQEQHEITNSQLSNYFKTGCIRALYTTAKNIMTTDFIQTERDALMKSQLSDDFKIKCISTLYTLAKNIMTTDFIQTERESLMNSQLSDYLKINLISALYIAGKDIMTTDFIQTERDEILKSTLSDFYKTVFISKLYKTAENTFPLSLIQTERNIILNSQLISDFYKTTIIGVLYTRVQNNFPEEFHTMENLYNFAENTVLTPNQIRTELKTIMRLQEANSSQKRNLISRFFEATKHTLTLDLIKVGFKVILSSDTVRKDDLVDITLPLLDATYPYLSDDFIQENGHTPESVWLWKLLNTHWKSVKHKPMIQNLRKFRFEWNLTQEKIVATINTTAGFDNDRENLLIYIGHLKTKNIHSKKARLIINTLSSISGTQEPL